MSREYEGGGAFRAVLEEAVAALSPIVEARARARIAVTARGLPRMRTGQRADHSAFLLARAVVRGELAKDDVVLARLRRNNAYPVNTVMYDEERSNIVEELVRTETVCLAAAWLRVIGVRVIEDGFDPETGNFAPDLFPASMRELHREAAVGSAGLAVIGDREGLDVLRELGERMGVASVRAMVRPYVTELRDELARIRAAQASTA